MVLSQAETEFTGTAPLTSPRRCLEVEGLEFWFSRGHARTWVLHHPNFPLLECSPDSTNEF
jgi:hypothetical protein